MRQNNSVGICDSYKCMVCILNKKKKRILARFLYWKGGTLEFFFLPKDKDHYEHNIQGNGLLSILLPT